MQSPKVSKHEKKLLIIGIKPLSLLTETMDVAKHCIRTDVHSRLQNNHKGHCDLIYRIAHGTKKPLQTWALIFYFILSYTNFAQVVQQSIISVTPPSSETLSVIITSSRD